MAAVTKKTMKKPTGRPTKRSVALVDQMIEWLADGKTLSTFCRRHKISRTTVRNWCIADPLLSDRLARARRDGEEAIEDEIQDIADTRTADDDDVSHRKLQIYAREKRLVWSNVAKYGQKTQVGGAHDLPPLELSNAERISRMQKLLEVARQRRLKETTDGNAEGSSGE